ncbi:MAG: flavodoxin family protein [Candidatus Odinarchaeota archaeon]
MIDKILIVYYSLTGNTQFIAETIRDTTKADILELKPVKELKSSSSMKYMWGGFQATMKKKPKLNAITKNPLDYDLIFLGTPVWAWTYSPPMRSFLSMYDLSDKKVAIWTCSAGGPGKGLERFSNALKDTEIIGKIGFREPLNNNPEVAKKKAISWANEIMKKIS